MNNNALRKILTDVNVKIYEMEHEIDQLISRYGMRAQMSLTVKPKKEVLRGIQS